MKSHTYRLCALALALITLAFAQTPASKLVVPVTGEPAPMPVAKTLTPPELPKAVSPTLPVPTDSSKKDQKNAGVVLKEPASPLEQTIPSFRVEKKPISVALRALGRPFGITFIVEPDATSTEVTADMRDVSIRDALHAITAPYSLHYEERAGYITVRRNETYYFIIEYPSLTRKFKGSTSVQLAASHNSSSNSGGQNGSNTGSTVGNSNGGQQNQQDQATLSIDEEDSSDVWKNIEDQLASRLSTGESVKLDRFTGIGTLVASSQRIEALKPYISLVNRRINRQVHIKANIIEIALTDQQKLGADWSQALTSAGGVNFSGVTATNLTTVGASSLSPDSFTARIAAGKLGAVISALSMQGSVKTESNPSVTTLVNQTTYIKIGEDKTFFSLSSSTSITSGTTGTDVTSKDIYDRFTQTFGNVLKITPSVSEDNIITLIAAPSISKFSGVTVSPDGKQTGPNSESKATESIIRLHNGETGIMGGFVFTQDSKASTGIPYLERIPLLGRALKSEAKIGVRTELAILITATLDDF